MIYIFTIAVFGILGIAAIRDASFLCAFCFFVADIGSLSGLNGIVVGLVLSSRRRWHWSNLWTFASRL